VIAKKSAVLILSLSHSQKEAERRRHIIAFASATNRIQPGVSTSEKPDLNPSNPAHEI
jgi:hypothetical protein